MAGDFSAAQMVASALTGAILGSGGTWLLAPHTENRKARSQARSEAHQAIRVVVVPLLDELRKYRAHAAASIGRDANEQKRQHHSGDMVLCQQLLAASRGLIWWRRPLVLRRLKKLFGPGTVAVCEVYGDDAGRPEAVVGILVERTVSAAKHPGLAVPDFGDYDRALRCARDSKDVEALVRSLRRLSRCV